LILVALNSDILVQILTKNFGPKSKKPSASGRPPTSIALIYLSYVTGLIIRLDDK